MNSSTGSASSSSSAALSSVSSVFSSPVAVSSTVSSGAAPSADASATVTSSASPPSVATLRSSASGALASSLSSLVCSSEFRSGSDTIALLSMLSRGFLRAGSSGRPARGRTAHPPAAPSFAVGAASAEDRDDQLGKAVVQAGDDRDHHHDERQGDGRVRAQFPPRRPDHLAQLGNALAEEQRRRCPAFCRGVGTSPLLRGRTARLSRHVLTYAALNSQRILQGRRDSNPQPPVLETGTLPIELL